ncbi:MAG: TonB-dependent receptor plug domain-containing protein [Pseudomonadales bacterium]
MKRVSRKGLTLAFAGLLSAVSYTGAVWGEEEIEEVVVTGSYLKKSTENSATPLTIMSKVDLDLMASTDMKDVVSNMTFNSGSIGGSATAFAGGDNSTGNANVNLRNLGSGATLVLINGKRNVSTSNDNIGSGYVDLEGLIPNIALERVEVVKDGSSALYGSDAIAGVVNFITRKNFEGFELQYDYAEDSQTGKQQDNLISAILGVASDRGHLTMSASYLDRGGLQIGDRYDDYGRSGLSTFGQPGRYVALGGITPTPSFFSPEGSSTFGAGADPDCDLVAAADGPAGTLGSTASGLCIYDFSSFFNLVMEGTQKKAHVDGVFELSDTMEVYGSLSYANNVTSRGNSLYPDVSFAIIGPSHPGLQLDAARRGIAPVPYLALQRLVGGTYQSSFEERPVDTRDSYSRTNLRMNLGATIDLVLGGNDWTLDVSGTYSERQYNAVNPSDSLTSNTNAAYVGLGGPSCDALTGTAGSGNNGTGNCYYYNPFQTSNYDPVTGARWNTTDTSAWAANTDLTVAEAARLYQNPDELYGWIQGEIASQGKASQGVFDAVLAGDLMPLGDDMIGLAVGVQIRRDETSTDLDTNSNNNNFKFIYGAQDWTNELSASSVFAEVFVPVNEKLEITFAGRYEDFDELGQSSFDPKATLIFMATDDLTLRASVGTSFRVGSLLQLGGRSTTLLNSTDAFSGTGGLAFRPSLTEGFEGLEPEEADVFNLGLSWTPSNALEGLSIDADFYSYEYSNLISREGHQSLINRDNALRCPNGLNTDADAGPLCGVVGGVVYSVGEGIPDKVIRSEDGNLLRTVASYFNAPSLETSGVDLTVGYRFDVGNAGAFNTRLSASYTLDYDIVDDQGNSIDGVGSRNGGNSIGRPLPEFKANWSFGWERDRHSASMIIKHIDGYTDDVPQSGLRGAYIGFAPEIDSHTTVDVQYNYQLPDVGFHGDGSMITIGAKNATDEVAPLMNVDGAYDALTHDPRGRIVYMRYRLAM